MTYTPTRWNDDGPPPISAANLNRLEQGVQAAHVTADAALPTATAADGFVQIGADRTTVPLRMSVLTRAAYDAIAVPDPSTVYVIL